MKCDKCGAVPNPGDQICINCGAKLSIANTEIPEVMVTPEEPVKAQPSKKADLKFIGLCALVLVAVIILTVVVTLAVVKG